MQCPRHELLLGYDPNAKAFFCPWPGCDFVKADYQNVTGSLTPDIEELFRGIQYSIDKGIDKVEIRAKLPRGFGQQVFTRIYHLHDAKDFNMTEGEWIEYQKREMLKDLLQRIKTERG